MRIAVIGDIHANAGALAAALDLTRHRGFDRRILLGDLLTYGVDVSETLDLVLDAVADGRTALLRGNHDAVYDAMIRGRRDLGPAFPAWVEAHAIWTFERLDRGAWQALPFRNEVREGPVLFAHANPFGPGDWRYVNDRAACLGAAAVLSEIGATCGVFGHTHRAGRFSRPAQGTGPSGFLPFDYSESPLSSDRVTLLNAGSPGQPRAAHPREVVLWIEIAQDGGVSHRFEPLACDAEVHCSRLRSSVLPEPLKQRCLSFHATF